MSDSTRSLAEVRGLIVKGLRVRRQEIEQSICVRIHDTVPYPATRGNTDYESGLQEAITAVVGFGLDALEKGPDWLGPIPPAAAAQARFAARIGINLGTIQRGYFTGHREFGEFVIREIERLGLSDNGEVVHHLRRAQEALLEHLAAEVEHEYHQEQDAIGGSHRAEIVQKLLSGEDVTPAQLAELDYEIDTYWHLGLIVSGPNIEKVVRDLEGRDGCRLLCVSVNMRVWAWLGTEEAPEPNSYHLTTLGERDLSLSIGEPGNGLDGWRLTHHQARAAFAVAVRRPERMAWYSDTRLLAAALENKTLARSLTQKYLLPIGGQSDGGAKLRRTLRAYIDLECNATSAAHGLQVGRHTVESRVRTAERLIGATLRDCLPELDVALQLEELNQRGGGNSADLRGPDYPGLASSNN